MSYQIYTEECVGFGGRKIATVGWKNHRALIENPDVENCYEEGEEEAVEISLCTAYERFVEGSEEREGIHIRLADRNDLEGKHTRIALEDLLDAVTDLRVLRDANG